MTEQDIRRVIRRARMLHTRMVELEDTIRDELTALSAQYTETMAELEDLLYRNRSKTARMAGDQFTRVQSTTTTYDAAILKRNLTREQRAAVIKEVVDTKALEAAVDSGLIKPHQVRDAMSRRPNKAYIKVTWRTRIGHVAPDEVIPEGRKRK